MNKQEFTDRLRAALNGRISAAQVEDTINYYQDYISTQIRSGKSEAEVMGALGDPRLIARTIIETAQPVGDNDGAHGTGGSYQSSAYQSGTYRSGTQESYNSYRSTGEQTTHQSARMPGWLVAIIIAVVVFLLFSVVFSVLSFLAPVIIVIVAVVFLVKLFRDWLN